MTEDERRALGQGRRLVFQNLANGVPEDRLREDLHLSQLELDQARRFVARKITEYLVLRRQAPVPCDDVRAIRWNRRQLLAVLARIGNLDLGTDLILAKVTIQALDHPEMIAGARHRMAEAHQR
jgi:hypothetical protein